MAESDTILQLGIEAAREGNREEARNLFGLLTRQEPNNAQAWLWLAGVAEGPDQRRAALERVVELDPTNEMAIKGLQAMGVRPTTQLGESAAPATEAPPPAESAPAHDMTDEERYAQELDTAFDDYDALPRAEVPARPAPGDADASGDTLAAEPSTGQATPGGTARERSAARRATTPIPSGDDDDDYLRADSSRRGLSPLMLGLIGLIVAVLLCVGLYPFIQRLLGGTGGTAASATATALAIVGAPTLGPTSALPDTGIDGTGSLTPTSELSGTGVLTETTPTSETAPPTGTSAPEQPAPTAVPQPPAGGAIPAPSANPNLQPVAIGEQLQANGWTYNYPNASYVLVLGKQVGNFTAQGTYLHVLVWVANNTGTNQPLPANFFALKDANNAVYLAAPQVSSVAVQRGLNADAGMEDPIPANGLPTSVYLVFDVAPGAPGLTLFASANNGQGWPLNIVP
jgi:hypothetical protein